jgi:hypothetical protein
VLILGLVSSGAWARGTASRTAAKIAGRPPAVADGMLAR